jgi:ABC-type dipeptide/oligopeptide/nickel transport system ATPase component
LAHVTERSDGHETLLDVCDLITHFQTPRGTVRAVDGVSLRLSRGRTLGIVGESGSGKTILARSIMGLLPTKNVVRGGEVWLGDRNLAATDVRQLREIWGKDIGMVFQNPMTSLNPVRRVGRQIMAPLRRHLDLSKVDARAKAEELLRSVGIPDPVRRLDDYPHELSGGMRQRIMIAIAIARDRMQTATPSRRRADDCVGCHGPEAGPRAARPRARRAVDGPDPRHP